MNNNIKGENKAQNKNVAISIYGNKNTIHIWRNVLRLLGFPKYFAIRKDKPNKRILVMPCKDKDILSFKLHEDFISNNDSKVTIHSKPFILDIMNSNKLDITKTYIINGKYLDNQNLAVFNVNDAVLFTEYNES